MSDPIWDRLREIRAAGDIEMALPPVIRPWNPETSTGFRSNAPHRVGIAHLRLRPRFMLLDPTGTGKTPQVLVAFGMMWAQMPPQTRMRLLVLCGRTAQFQWVQSVSKFLVGPRAKVVGYHPDTARKLRADIRVMDYHDTSYDVLTTTYTTFADDIDTIRDMDLQRLVVVCDEAHKLRGLAQTKLRPAFQSINSHARAIWLLTASPLFRDIMNLYAMADLVRPGMLGTEREFANRYMDRTWISFVPKARRRPGASQYGGPGKWHVKAYKNLDQLRALLEPWSLQRPLTAFEGQIPDFRVLETVVDLDPDHRTMYDSVVAHRFPVTGLPMDPLAAVSYTQMMVDAPQVLGYETVKPPAKLAGLLDLLRDNYAGSKVLVYSRYATVCQWLQQELMKAGYRTGLVTGEVPMAQQLAAIREFQDGPPTGDTANPASSRDAVSSALVLSDAGGESLDLQQARVLVLYDLPWAGGTFIQLLGRLRRTGSRHGSVLLHVLTASATVDSVTPTVLHAQLTVTAHLALHSSSTSASSTASPSTSHSIAAQIASLVHVRQKKTVTSDHLEEVLRRVIGEGRETVHPATSGYPTPIPSSEEDVNASASSTSTPVGSGDSGA